MVRRMYDSTLVSKRIKSLRKEKKWLQRQLSDISGISIDSLKSYESGRRIPDTYNLEQLAKAFRVDTSYLLGGTDYKNKWDEYDELHEEDIRRTKAELQFIESAEALGFYHQDIEDPEQDYQEYINYNRLYQERKAMMKTRSDIKVVTGANENQIIYSFVTDEITIQAKTEADVETCFQKLIERGIISE